MENTGIYMESMRSQTAGFTREVKKEHFDLETIAFSHTDKHMNKHVHMYFEMCWPLTATTNSGNTLFVMQYSKDERRYIDQPYLSCR